MAIPPRINRNANRDRAVVAAHMNWVAAEIDSECALRAWFDGAPPQAAGSYLAYRAAVDREESAARCLQRLSELTPLCQQRLAQSE